MDKLSRFLLPLLLLAAATVFTIGVAVERSQGDHHTEASPSTGETTGETGTHLEGGAEPPAVSATEVSSEKLFGVNTESIPVVTAFFAVSALLAIAVVLYRPLALLLIVALFGALATAFDIREVLHQIDESRHAVATLASVTAAGHILVGLLAMGTAVMGGLSRSQ